MRSSGLAVLIGALLLSTGVQAESAARGAVTSSARSTAAVRDTTVTPNTFTNDWSQSMGGQHCDPEGSICINDDKCCLGLFCDKSLPGDHDRGVGWCKMIKSPPPPFSPPPVASPPPAVSPPPPVAETCADLSVQNVLVAACVQNAGNACAALCASASPPIPYNNNSQCTNVGSGLFNQQCPNPTQCFQCVA